MKKNVRMRTRILFLSISIMVICSSIFFNKEVNAYIAHEWGTFTSVVGSDGKMLQGLHHEEEGLPSFVYDLSKLESRNIMSGPTRGFVPLSMDSMPIPVFSERITQKMETPVIYFYSDKEENLSVNVKFPQGVISQWYPMAVRHNTSEKAISGFADWDLTILNTKEGDLPETSGNSIWNPSRQVNSNIIKIGNEFEKLIFYRGLADFETPLKTYFKDNQLIIKNESSELINGLSLLNNQDEISELISIESIGPHSEVKIDFEQNFRIKNATRFKSFDNFLGDAKKTIVTFLINSGLYPDESKAMVNTWEKGYFQTKGLRLLYVLPREWTDSILSINMSPRPSELVRTLVGRIEILTPQEEKKALNFAETKIMEDEDLIFEVSGREMKGLGHFPEPKLRRVLELTQDQKLKTKINDFITQMNSGF